MRILALWLTPGALLLSGCATAQPAKWGYKPDSGVGVADGPLALWGEEETLASTIVRCKAPERMLEIEELDIEPFSGARPVRITSGGASWSGEQRMDPPDAVAIARARLPLDHPVVISLERGNRLTVAVASSSSTLPPGAAVQRVIAECRAAAAAGATVR